MKLSAPHLLWREHEHPKKGLFQSRSDRAHCICVVKVLPASLRENTICWKATIAHWMQCFLQSNIPEFCLFGNINMLLSPSRKIIHPLELVEVLF